jgi:hypothetical protein
MSIVKANVRAAGSMTPLSTLDVATIFSRGASEVNLTVPSLMTYRDCPVDRIDTQRSMTIERKRIIAAFT